MIIYGVYKTIQENDSDGWQYWTDEELIKLFTEKYNAETYINDLLLEDIDKLLKRTIVLSNDLTQLRKDTDMMLNNKGIFSIGCDNEDIVKNLYTIRELEIEECPSIHFNNCNAG